MIAVIFEVWPAAGRMDDYLAIAASLRSDLGGIDGFISVEPFQSLADLRKLLSLSFWRDEGSRQNVGATTEGTVKVRGKDGPIFSRTIASELRLSCATME